MSYVLIPIVAACASMLTFFSGFGLGTILLPAFAAFFSVELAVVMTAIVHLLNNLFKLVLVGKFAHRQTIVRFGLPAVLAAFFGAWVLSQLSELAPLYSYQLLERTFDVLPIELLIGILIIAFTTVELLPSLRDAEFHPRLLPLGGILSGFFGGLSGHQGALRSAFLARAGLTKEQFIATGVVIACLVDFSRMSVYFNQIHSDQIQANVLLLIITTLAAFAGAFLGNKLLKKITMSAVQRVVSVSLILLGLALAVGLI